MNQVVKNITHFDKPQKNSIDMLTLFFGSLSG